MIAACLLIAYDLGGEIFPRLEAVRDNPCVVINGYCASACTLHLSAEDVCLGPDAVLGFHGPIVSEEWQKHFYITLVAEHYPPKLREWYLNGPVYLGANEIALLTTDEAEALGVQVCQSD